IQQAGSFSVTVTDTEKKKTKFAPSALAKNPRTGEWYIVSSVNKLLVVADANWKVKQTYPLSVSIFPQPEGIAFDKSNNLYISNEGNLGNGNILKFVYKK
ncbi:MAG: SdiA-regulated family protein, partial [Sphingobacteriaceae bacterium]